MAETFGFKPWVALTSERCPECGNVTVKPENVPTENQRLCGQCLSWYYAKDAELFPPGEDPNANAEAV